jgi:hypothetical protein
MKLEKRKKLSENDWKNIQKCTGFNFSIRLVLQKTVYLTETN